jgi:hypothetical protein
MKTILLRLSVLPLGLVVSLNVLGKSPIAEPNWDQPLAMSVIQQADTRASLKTLFQLAQSPDPAVLLAGLDSVVQDPAIQDPVRDYLVFTFTTGLSDLDSDEVNPRVLDYLAAYQVRTRVAHPDYPHVGLPLFNVRAAVAGVRHGLARANAATRAEGLFEGRLDDWIAAYLEASATERNGFADALDFATPGQLGLLGWLAAERLEEQPALTIVAARAGLASGDYLLLENAICRGSGPGVLQALKAASNELADDEAAELLQAVLHSGSAVNASLAIAELSTDRLDQPEVVDLLFARLPDRDLGMAAALALGASRQPEVHARLQGAVAEHDGPVQRRAQMALQVNAQERGFE